MKVKDLVDLKGCYSAYDVGELEVPVLSVDEISEIISKSELTRLALLKWTERSSSAIEFDKKIKTIAEAIIKAREEKRK